MSDLPFFSIVVPTYDRPEMLAQALDSVQRQTFEDFECIVVEDAPPTSNIHLPADGRFHLARHEQNRGASGARNTGLRRARGKYVTFLDDDDVYAPRRLEMVRPLVRHDRVVICGRAGLDMTPAHYRDLQGDVRDLIWDGFTPHLGQTVIPRDVCPEFDERYPAMEDVEWWLRLSHALPVVSTPELGYLMRTHLGVRHGNGKAARAECSRQLLEQYEAYFARHSRARGFRLERHARLELLLGRRRVARGLAWRSVAAMPRPRSLVLAFSITVAALVDHQLRKGSR